MSGAGKSSKHPRTAAGLFLDTSGAMLTLGNIFNSRIKVLISTAAFLIAVCGLFASYIGKNGKTSRR